jgi:diketogulonate reductase-like aldo/keto reductase
LRLIELSYSWPLVNQIRLILRTAAFYARHRPVRGHDDRNADREPACAVSPQAAPGQLTRSMNMATADTLRYTRIPLTHGSGAMPAVGFGTLIPDPLATKHATKTAPEVGFRHLDCAERYRNEEAVGDAMQEAFRTGTVRREDVFVTTKLWNTNHRAERVKPAFDASRRRLQIDYVDCYLIHTLFSFRPGEEEDPRDERGQVIYDPGVTLVETWRALERLVDDGQCKSIGLSDVTLEKLREIVAATRTKPAVVQVESHPYLPEWELLDFCREHGIVLLAFAALGHGLDRKELDDPVITAIAQRVHKTPAQVAGLGRTARHRFPDHLDHTSPYPGEL